jgi:hypothetical protein
MSFTLVEDGDALQVRATCTSNKDIRDLMEALGRRLEKPFAAWADATKQPAEPEKGDA